MSFVLSNRLDLIWLIVFYGCPSLHNKHIRDMHTYIHGNLYVRHLVFVSARKGFTFHSWKYNHFAMDTLFCSYSYQWCSDSSIPIDRAAVYQHKPPGLTWANPAAKLIFLQFENLAVLITQVHHDLFHTSPWTFGFLEALNACNFW